MKYLLLCNFLSLLSYHSLIADHDILICYFSGFFLHSLFEISECLAEHREVARVYGDRITLVVEECWDVGYEEGDMVRASELGPRPSTVVGTYIDPATSVHIERLDTLIL